MKLDELIEHLDYKDLVNFKNVEVTGISYNSKKTAPNDLFICLTGEHVDGHEYAEEAFDNGAIAFVVERRLNLDAPQIVVENTSEIIAQISDFFFGSPSQKLNVIGVTGTNGKTTVSNMINDVLEDNGYKVINNRYGSNMNTGIAASFVNNNTITGKNTKDIAVFEMDERSTIHIFKYITPTYLVCNNLSRDSLKRNAHTAFIAGIINNAIPKATTVITNGDDPICVNLASENKKIYFGIDRLDTDTEKCENIVQDMVLCPKCGTKLEYEYYRYHHVGKMKCPNCGFGTPKRDYETTKIDFENKLVTIKDNDKNTEYSYSMVADGIINIYNMLSAIVALKQVGVSDEKINEALKKTKIVDTRFSQDEVAGKKIVLHLAKGQNPIACSRVFDYVRKQPEKKTIILFLDDLHEDNETITWFYDTDYEFLNGDNVEQIIVSGKRAKDTIVRLLMAGVPKEKIFADRDEVESVRKYFKPKDIESVYVLYDLYAMKQKEEVHQEVKKILEDTFGKKVEE